MIKIFGIILASFATVGGIFLFFSKPLSKDKASNWEETVIDEMQPSSYRAPNSDEMKSLNENQLNFAGQLEKINETKEELHGYTDNEILSQISSIKSYIYNSNLIERLNNNLTTEDERDDAKDVLVRFALLGFEKTRRNLNNLQPELAIALKNHRENVSKIKQMIDNLDN